MSGRIRTKEVCPKCGGKFAGEPLHCPACLTIPRRYFVHFSWHSQPIKLYKGKDNHPLDSWERAYRLLTAMRNEADLKTFDPKDYAPKEIKQLWFEYYLNAWIERRSQEQERGHISKSYLRTIRFFARKYYVPFFGPKRSIREIINADIEDFRNWLPPHLSGKSVWNIMGVLHKLFQDAHRRKDILRMPDFPRVQVGEPVIRWITEEQQGRILSRLKEPYKTFFLFLMRQGCRPNEARALQWQSVNLKENRVVIKAAMDMDEYRPYTKERDVRYLPIHPDVARALTKLPRSLTGYVFINRAGRPLSAARVGMQWRQAAAKAGIDIGMYQGTKHSLGCQAVNRGVSLYLLAEFFGHRDAQTTKKYAKVETEAMRGVWGEVEREKARNDD